MMKRVLRAVMIVLASLAALFLGLLIFLTVTEYHPQATEDAAKLSSSDAADSPSQGSTVSVMTWNIGYAGLGAGSDFFMDGGKNTASADKATVTKYLQGIAGTVAAPENEADIHFFQEVDTNSQRSFRIDETQSLLDTDSFFALNFSVAFIPYPIPPIGSVHCGLLNTTHFKVESSKRIALPSPFSWPVRLANLKRCLLVNYIPIKNSDKYLAAVDLHLEAYDDGEGKKMQTAVLQQFILSEYQKGNYVIAGGDFNQLFPGAAEAYPNTHPDLWTPGELSDDLLPEGFEYACDLDTPSCRLDNQPYNAADTVNTQYYVIDGFIFSPNITVSSVKTVDAGFADSDHNPVRLTMTLN